MPAQRSLRFSLPLLAALLVGLPALAATKVSREGDKLVLENEFVKAVVSPKQGARLESFVCKQLQGAPDLVAGPTVVESVVLPNDALLPLADLEFAEAGQGGFEIQMPSAESLGQPGSEFETPYFNEVDYRGVRLRKEFSLADDSSTLAISYQLTNNGAQPATVCLSLLHEFSTPGGRRPVLSAPTVLGVREVPMRRVAERIDDLSGGWAAITSEKGDGAARWIEPKYAGRIQLVRENARRMEIQTVEIQLAPKQSVSFQTAVLPLMSMASVDDVGQAFVVGLKIAPPEAAAPATYAPRQRITGNLSLLPARKVQAGMRLTVRRLPEERELPISVRAETPFLPGFGHAIDFAFVPTAPGTWILKLTIARQGTILSTVERSVVVGSASGPAPGPVAIQRAGPLHQSLRKAFPPPADYQPAMDVPSPFIAYAKPFAQGSVRALFLFPYWAGREVVECAQRMDLEYDMAAMGVGPLEQELKTGPAPAEEQARALDLLAKPHDVIVAGHSWGYWPAEVRQEVLRQVKAEGAGLVCFRIGWQDDDLTAIQKNAKPLVTRFAQGNVSGVDYGKGRVLFMDKGPLRISVGVISPRSGAVSGTWETAVQALIYAARKEGKLDVSCQLPGAAVNAEAPGAVVVNVLSRDPQPFKGKVEVVFRQLLDVQYRNIYWFYFTNGTWPWWEDRATVSQDVAVNPGQLAKLSVDIPALPAGEYAACAILRDWQGRVCSWRSYPFKVQSPVAVAELWLNKPGGQPVRGDYAGAAMPQIGFKPAETLHARVVVQRDDAKAPGPLSVSLRLLDGGQRLVFLQRKPANAQGEAVFSAPLSHALHYATIATVTAYVGDKPMGETRALLPVHRYPERNELYRFTQLDNEGWQPNNMMGVTEYNNGSSWDRFLECASQDYLFQAFGSEVVRAKLNAENVRAFCYNNPEQTAKIFEAARKNIAFAVQFAPHGHLFVDEYTYGGRQACQCNFCQSAYREFLKRAYGTIDALNRQYGSAHRSWEDARLYILPDKAAIPPQDWPQALDTCVWKTVQMTDYCDKVVQIGKAISPEVEFGFSGAYKMSLDSGNDFWHSSQVGKYHILYRDVNEWAGMAGAMSVRQWRWYWRKYNPAEQRLMPWAVLFNGEPGTGVYTCEKYPSCYPDGRMFEGPKAYFEEFREINNGAARLLLGHEARDGIAVHWSSPSFYTYALERWNAMAALGKDPSKDVQMDWPRRTAHFLEGSASGPNSLAAHYVAHGQIEKGSLGLYGRPKVVFLTYSPAMSRQEADVLRKFVQEGGTLVGQVNPASRDAHARPWPNPLLDDVFGVKHDGFQPPVPSSGRSPESIKAEEKDKVKPGIRVSIAQGFGEPLTLYPLVLAPANVRAAGAQAFGEYEVDGRKVPAAFVNKFGQGQAVLLNFLTLHMNEITGESWDEATQNTCATLAKKLVEMAGVKPWATVAVNGEPGGASLHRFEDGANVYLGVTMPWGNPPAYYTSRKTEVTLAKPFHVYDVRGGKYLGLTDKVSASFTWDHLANLYACLPYKVNALNMTLPAAPAPAGTEVAIDLALHAEGQPGRHVFRVEVWDPAGRLAKKYNYNFDAAGGRGKARIFLALNDPAGAWKVRCTDVASGASAEANFTVTPPAGSMAME